jgi:opacity protein-like surface antigen
MMAATPAIAADLPVLPWLNGNEGPAPTYVPFGDGAQFTDWRGFYVGGLFSYSDVTADFSKATQAPIAFSLRQTEIENEFNPSSWPVLGTASHGVTGFGGFVGYNTEYLSPSGRIVLGFEGNYEHTTLSLVAPNAPLSRTQTLNSGAVDSVTLTGSGTLSNLDFATVRGRAGWDFNGILPYVFAGLAVGRADLNVTETTTVVQTLPGGAPQTFVFTGTAGKNSEWLWGYAVGAGLDFALTNHFFLRGEYEYVQFEPVANTSININTVRVGAAVKF